MWSRSLHDDLFDVFRDFDSLFRRTFADFALPSDTGRLLISGSSGGSGLSPAAFAAWPSFARGRYVPAAESYVKDGRIFIRAELPGVDPHDVQVSLTGDRVQISGEKKASHEVRENDVWIREVSRGRFERSFTLPQGAKSDQIKARFENGVLELSMPVPSEAEPKKVQIQIGDGKGGRSETS